MNDSRESHDVMDQGSRLAFRQPFLDIQLNPLTDESFQVVGFSVLTENDAIQNFLSTSKTLAPVAFGSKKFTLSEQKAVLSRQNFFSNLYLFIRIWTQSSWNTKTGRRIEKKVNR